MCSTTPSCEFFSKQEFEHRLRSKSNIVPKTVLLILLGLSCSIGYDLTSIHGKGFFLPPFLHQKSNFGAVECDDGAAAGAFSLCLSDW